MNKFKDNKLLILQEMERIVSMELEIINIDPHIEEHINEYLIDMREKRNARKLKYLRLELKKWIEQMASEERKLKIEQKYDQAKIH